MAVAQRKMAKTYSGDVQARWTIKAEKPYYGYNIHIATDGEHGFIIGGHTTQANRADTRGLTRVAEESGLEQGAMILPDKGYSSLDNWFHLEELGLTDGIMYKASGVKNSLSQKCS